MENWSTLFASPADCACDDCSSVFSPAAYLVDIMQYLDNTVSDGQGTKSVLQVLFERRPDIGNLLLTCENTNTEIPYIDLVNEIMEYYIVYCSNGTRIVSDVHASASDPNVSTLIVASGTPTVIGNVTNGSNQLILSVSASTITGVNFGAGDIIILSGEAYHIATVPVIPGTANNITLTLDRNFAETSNANLPASSIEIYRAAADTGAASAEELKAEPQYTLLDAYKQIYRRVYPFNLPYHQPLDVIRAYLKFLKTSRPELMEVFGQYYAKDNNNPPNITLTPIPQAAIDAEWIQLSLKEYEILTGIDFSGVAVSPVPAVEDFFGDPSPAYTGYGILVTGILQRTGLQYMDLLSVLETKFISPGQNAYNVLQNLLGQSTLSAATLYTELKNNTWQSDTAFTGILATLNIAVADFTQWLSVNFTNFQQTVTLYESTSECDIDDTFLHSIGCIYETPPVDIAASPAADIYVTKDFLSRLHRFIRLWRRTGWAIHELDNMITALGETDITPSLIHKLSLVSKVNAVLGLPLLQLACLWGDIDNYGDNSVNVSGLSLYAQLFLRNTGNIISAGKLQQSIFAPNPLSQLLAASTDPAYSFAVNLPVLLAALNISGDEFQSIAANWGIDMNDAITIKGLSAVYRYKLLADALGFSIEDLCTLETLFHPAFGSAVAVSAASTGSGLGTLLIKDNVPSVVRGNVQNGTPKITLSVSASNIAGVNFNAGDLIILNGTKYSIDAPLPVIPGTSASIIINLERNYTGASNPNLAASSIQFFLPDISVTLDFIQKAQKVQQSGFSVTELNYILSGNYKGIDNIALSNDSILTALQNLRAGLLKINSDNPASDLNTITPAILSQKLQLLCTKEISDQFILMLSSTIAPVLTVTVPDQSFSLATLPPSSQPKYAYVTTLAFSPVSGQLQTGEIIKDSNGSSAIIISISGNTLLLSTIILSAGQSGLTGTITGNTSSAQATVNQFTMTLQLTGFMTDAERAVISGSAGFNSSVNILYQQSLDALNLFFLFNVQVLDNSYAIPTSLTPKYFYTQSGTSCFLQCRGLMTDDEFNQLGTQGNAQFQSAVKYIYTYPYSFLKNNFSGIYQTENDLDTACLYLYGISKVNAAFVIPPGYSPINDLKGKMQYFYGAFLPFVISQLKIKHVLTSVSTLIGLDIPVLDAFMNQGDINFFISDASETGLTASYYKTDFTDPNPAVQTDPEINLNWSSGANSLPSNIPSPGSALSVRWKGWISPPADGDYIFTFISSDKTDVIHLSLNDSAIADLTQPVTLAGGKLISVIIEYIHTTGNSGIQLYWQSSTMPQVIIDTAFLYADADINALSAKINLYDRAADTVNGFTLTAPELSYFIANPADFGNINFLPVTGDQWLRTYDYTSLRKIMPAGLLLPVFQTASSEDKASPGALPSDLLVTTIANANKPGWIKSYVSFLAGNKDSSPSTASFFSYKAADFKNEIALLRIKKAMDLAVKTKMQVNSSGLPMWTWIETNLTTDTDFDTLNGIAGQIKNAVKGKYSDNWLTIATRLNNSIRENQKQALIAFLLTLNLQSPDGSGPIIDADALFEYLLIDVQTTSAVVSSRLIQATLAVQLFADRCLLGMESEVKPDPVTGKFPIDADEWEWMKHYSVAAGLKKLFVYVENYLDPSLRDDKSPFFTDFESTLKKSDITVQNVENAFRDYLYKLNEVSNMEICGTYYDQAAATIHVFARTHAAPYKYYYRTAYNGGQDNNSWSWNPWQEVQLDIKSVDDGDNSGVHIMPVIWSNRLFIFWPEFAEKTVATTVYPIDFQQMASVDAGFTKPQKYWEIRFGWSEYANGKWTPKKLSKEVFSTLLAKWEDSWSEQWANGFYVGADIINPDAGLPPRYLIPEIPCSCFSFSIAVNPTTQILEITIGIGSEKLSTYSGNSVPLAVGTVSLPDITGKLSVTTSSQEISNQSTIIDDSATADYGNNNNFSTYQPFFEDYRIADATLNFSSIVFLRKPTDHKILFSNDVPINNFEKNIPTAFFYSDLDNNRSYFVTPLKDIYAVNPRKPGHPKINPVLNNFKDKINAPLYIYDPKVNVSLMQVKAGNPATPVLSSRLASVPAPTNRLASVAAATGQLAFVTAASDQLTESVHFDAPPPPQSPSVNNLDSSVSNQYSIGDVVAKGTKKYYVSKSMDLQAFAGGWIFLPHVSKLAFYTFYHPFASTLIKKINQGGVPALMAADTAEFPEDANYPDIDNNPVVVANDQGTVFGGYNPNFGAVQQYDPSDLNRNYYLQNVDFSMYGTYSGYNWELFFHAPFLIATSLSKNGKYAEARKWFHYIFNPLSTETPDSPGSNSPFWQVLPFKTQPDWEFTTYIQGLTTGYDNDTRIDAWRQDPFNAFLIARARPIAFMKNVVMNYLDNLIAWGDDLFRSYTRENINEAVQLYVTAARILGPAPQYVAERGMIQSASYNQLKTALDDFGDAVVQLENAFPNSSSIQQSDNTVPQNLLGIGRVLYFCVPANSQLLSYWTLVGDRLFKIRHGENINGLVVPLALYEPPIDPALLLQAKAQGIDVAGILADLESPAPLYRFSYLIQKAREFCNEIISLGSALLSANEKQDAEQLSRLRQTQEIAMLNLVTDVKTRQVLEAQANLDELVSNRATAMMKLSHYVEELLGNQPAQVPDSPVLSDDLDENSTLPGETIINQVTASVDTSLESTDETGVKVIPKEKQEMDYIDTAYDLQISGSSIQAIAGILHALPNLKIHATPIGVGAATSWGGTNLGNALNAAGAVLEVLASGYTHAASNAAKLGTYIRREQEWAFQANITAREIIQTDKQIIVSQIRLQMAQHELANHRQQIDNADDIEQFLETKFSNQELYQWMNDKLEAVHKQGYQIAYDMARKAEKAYRFELGIQDTNFVQYGYYQDAYLGITAGEQLQLAIRQMDGQYVENNTREFELIRSISLVQLNPLALLQVRETGSCQFSIPEELVDLDYPGHFFRRLKYLRVFIPCVAGPFITINSTLRLIKSSIRINTVTDSGYARKVNNGIPADDSRFVENNIPCSAMATSSAQNDSGLFELNYRDDRYLPFEGAGMISTWQLELNGRYLNTDDGTVTDLSQFDYDSITDIIFQIGYTSREDDGDFRQSAIGNLGNFKGPFNRMFSARHEFPTEWYAFLNQPAATGDQTLNLLIDKEKFNYFASRSNPVITGIALYGEGSQLPALQVISPGNVSNTGYSFGQDTSDYGNLLVSNPGGQSWQKNNLGMWKIVKPGNPVIAPSALKNLYVVVSYMMQN